MPSIYIIQPHVSTMYVARILFIIIMILIVLWNRVFCVCKAENFALIMTVVIWLTIGLFKLLDLLVKRGKQKIPLQKRVRKQVP